MAECPQCRQGVQLNYRFCQQCGFDLSKTWTGSALSKLFGSVEAGKNVHRLAQNGLWKIGKDLSFHSMTDFVPDDAIPNKRSDLIDVVWKTGNEVEFAFEIRARTRDLDWLGSHGEDIVKLQNLKAKRRFFVNVSNKSGKAFFNEVGDEPDQNSPKASRAISMVDNSKYRIKVTCSCGYSWEGDTRVMRAPLRCPQCRRRLD